MVDSYGQALLDYQNGKYQEDIVTYSSLDEKDILPLPYMFRDFEEMPLLEQKAMKCAKGTVLDIGCGAGSHSLHLQEKGFDVTGLDTSQKAIEVCALRGLKKQICTDILNHNNKKYDTLLLLMNGIGIAKNLKELPRFLNHLKSLVKPGGQVLLDSSDIIYMFDTDEDGGHWIYGNVNYYGEVQFQMEYKNQKGPTFDWLYIDFYTLKNYAEKENLKCELMAKGGHYDYLVRLTLK